MGVQDFEPDLQAYIAAGKKLRVLVADANEHLCTTLQARLETRGIETVGTQCGDQALALIHEQMPDLVLLDASMETESGKSLLGMLRSRFSKRQLAIIAMTAADRTGDIVQALESGASDYVSRPVDFDVLWARLNNQLMQKQAADYLRCAQKSLDQHIRQRTAELNSSNQKLKRVIQERLLAEDRLQRQANYDDLTGLPNRSLAKDRLEQTISKAKRQGLNPAVAFLDLDNFKQVNDTLGHAAGDELLKQAATRLAACARRSDTVARLGGDEFLLILDHGDKEPSRSRETDIKRFGERVINSFSRPFVLGGAEVAVTPSLGFAIYPKDGQDLDALMRSADTAMYRSKKEGRNSYRFYSSEMSDSARMRAAVESRLCKALERGEFALYYQPIVEAQSGEIVKAEAFLRWSNSELGLTAPEFFIQVAEQSGLIVPIGEWMIQSACEQLRKWRRTYTEDISVSVNVSARQLQPDALIDRVVADALKIAALPGGALELEITEDILLSESHGMVKTLQAIEALGVGLVIDDFGRRQASISSLQRYNARAVKLYRGHVNNVLQRSQDARLVRAIASMAESLGVAVVADGVESSRQQQFLKSANCRYLQGQLFSRALSAAQFEALLRGQAKAHSAGAPRQAPTNPSACTGS